jgi:DUF4097 and DUF4098 domain-containing protein YvlB
MTIKTMNIKTPLHFGSGLVACLSLGVGMVLSASEYDRNIEKEFQVSSGGKLIVQADRGSIELKSDARDKIQVRVLRRVKGGSQAQADELFANHDVTFRQDGNSLSILGRNKKAGWRLGHMRQPSMQVRYEIRLPKRFDVDLKTSGGDIRLGELEGSAITRTSSGSIDLGTISGRVEAGNSGGDILVAHAGGDLVARTSSGAIKVGRAIGKVEVSNSGGDIRLDKADKDVVASTSSGSMTLKTVQGGVEAKNSGGDINIETAAGDVSAQTSSGSISVGHAAGKHVSAKNSGGDIRLGEIEGDIVAQTSSGTIKIAKAKGKAEVKNSGGQISIGEAVNNLVAETSSGSIEITTAQGQVEVKNSGGDVRIGSVEGETVASTSSGSIVIKLAKGKVDARNSGGKIEVNDAHDVVLAHTSSGPIIVGLSAQPKADSHLEVSGGDIKVTLPRSAAIDVDARSNGGKVVSAFPVTSIVSGELKPGTLRGKINGGGSTLTLRASSGDIRLNESAARSE